MKNVYSATIKMNSAEQLARFIDKIGPLVESVLITSAPAEGRGYEADRWSASPSPNRIINESKPPRVRVSKVNGTILDVLQQHGEASVKELKEALESAGLSPGSLSTGIAMLQRSGEIERVREGVYGIVSVPQAAE